MGNSMGGEENECWSKLSVNERRTDMNLQDKKMAILAAEAALA